MKLVFSVLERVGDCEDKFARKYRDLVLDELKKGASSRSGLPITKQRDLLLGKEVYFPTATPGSWHQGD